SVHSSKKRPEQNSSPLLSRRRCRRCRSTSSSSINEPDRDDPKSAIPLRMKERRKWVAGSLPTKVCRQCFGDGGNLTTKFSVKRKSKRQKMEMIYDGNMWDLFRQCLIVFCRIIYLFNRLRPLLLF
ncbi:unnamed protein product, partial [Linum tenue]